MLTALLALTLASAQTPQEPGAWFTIPTEHYRIHYPAEGKLWAEHVAGQIEQIRKRVVDEVGYDPPEVVNVFIMDPYGSANGSVTLIRRPVIRLFATAPRPGTSIGQDRQWAELLVTHELTHQVHLSRPSRNPFLKGLTRAVGIPLLALTSPRWVAEGYATVVEGRLTGSGRPHSEARAAWLREMARTGQLPTYEGLDGGSEAYMVGSAYLEWLEARTGEDTLNDLIATMSSRRRHGFERAFERVFGDDPETLYGRFKAELTSGAMAIEHQRPVADTLWHPMETALSQLAASPDGSKVAFVAGKSTRGIQVWSTAEPEEPWARWEAMEELAHDKDPELPDASRPDQAPPDVLTSNTRLWRTPAEPAWMHDNQHLVFEASFPTPNGALRPDLVLWDTETDKETRLTKEGIHSPAPMPDGRILAVKSAWGLSSIVTVDSEGTITPVTEAQVAHPVAQPTVSPDGELAAWLRNDGGWKLVVHDLGTGHEHTLETPDKAWVIDPVWGPDNETLYASMGTAGFLEVWAFHLPTGRSERLTQTHGGARGAAIAGEDLYFTVDHFQGRDLHRQPLTDRAEDAPLDHRFAAAPILRPPPVEAPVPTVGSTESRRYRGGFPIFTTTADVHVGRAGNHVGFGAVLTDVPGRRTFGLQIAGGQHTPTGASVQFISRNRRTHFVSRLFFTSESRSRSSYMLGAELGARFRHNWNNGVFRLDTGLWGDLPMTRQVRPPRANAHLTLNTHQRWSAGSLAMGLRLRTRGDVGLTQTRTWGRLEGGGQLYAGRRLRLVLDAEGGRAFTASSQEVWTLGGIQSSVTPDGWQLGTVHELTLPVDTFSGPNRYRLEGRLSAFGSIHAFFRRHRVWGDCDGCQSGAASITGFELSNPSLGWSQQSWLDSVDMRTGLACIAENPQSGFAAACKDLSDWTAWFSVSTRL